MSEHPREFLESQRIVWARDFDAVIVGFLLGSLTVIAALWAWGVIGVVSAG